LRSLSGRSKGLSVARIGLGSNVADARANVESAVHALSSVGLVTARSSLYLCAPWGVLEQDDFINAVVVLETELTPFDLLHTLQKAERDLGRVATYRWGPRVIDLDILTYDDLALETPELTLPHPRLFERAFVLAPLAEIDPAYLPAYEGLSPEVRAHARRI
jgi:2-amino-4-hydroxy-6-hydroxymethyldihydropteridine diphosphokinase